MRALARQSTRPLRMTERTVMTYRQGWVILVSGFFEPLFYLLSVRIGMGRLVGTISIAGHPLRYVDFVAPALLAASSMNGAVYDSTSNVFDKIKYSRLYDTVLATPMTVADVAIGEIGWAMIRGQIYAVAFLVTMLVLGLAHTWWLLLALPICFLIGLAFASVGMAGATFGAGPTSTRSSCSRCRCSCSRPRSSRRRRTPHRFDGRCSCRRCTTGSRSCVVWPPETLRPPTSGTSRSSPRWFSPGSGS